MAATAFARPYGLDRHQSLLHLDCSADLVPYSRNLGPGVQEQTFQHTSDALRAQLEEHRDFLLRYQSGGQPRLKPIPQSSNPAPATPPVGSWKPYSQHHQYPSQPPQVVPTPQPIPSARVARSAPGDVSTYPRALREALEQCDRRSSSMQNNSAIYHVMEDTKSHYTDGDSDVVGTYRNMHSANLVAAQYFVENYLGLDVEEARFEVLASGGLHCEIEPDGSSGELVSVSVREGRLQ